MKKRMVIDNIKRVEMIGRRFGRLTVVALSPNTFGKKKRLKYYCDCDCGKKNIEVMGEHLRSGHTSSCGCLKQEVTSITHKKYNKYDLSGDYGVGWTTNTNHKFYFDIEDYDLIKNYSWRELRNGYVSSINGNKEYLYLHRIVMNAKYNEIVDHKKHNKLDNRKEFLRIGTRSNNYMNAVMRKNNTSGFTGVCLDKRNGHWTSAINLDGRKIHLGSFTNKEDAIVARKIAEEKYFSDWSYKNSNERYNNEEDAQ